MPIKNFHFEVTGPKPYVFYSYARGPELLDNMGSGNYDQEYIYLKSYAGFIYVASDPDSSGSGPYGKNLATFTLNPEARIVSMEEKTVSSDIRAELAKKHPKVFKDCPEELLHSAVVEDSGIDLVDYGGRRANWFELMRPTAIERVDVRYAPVPSPSPSP